MTGRLRLAAALAASVALASCSGGGSTKQLTEVVPPVGHPGSVATASKLTIVGVGDSLTAGVQSGGLMGADLPAVPGQLLFTQGTQVHGFFSILWQQANGVSMAAMGDPTQSPLPLITPPGIGGMLGATVTPKGFPAPLTNTCDSHQLPANQFSSALSLRENPALNPWDVGIPGQTVHEAYYMVGAIGDCNVTPADAPGSFVQLNTLVNGESQNFWPILAGFGQGVSQVQAAASLHAQVATVWLGSNDLLKIAFSGGLSPVTAPQAMHDDMVLIIRKLQGAGSKVAVANLVDVMGAATFIPQPAWQQTLQTYIAGGFVAQGVPALLAPTLAAPYATAYANQEIAQTGLGTAGYFTINALFKTLQAAQSQIQLLPVPTNPNSVHAPPLGSGDFIADPVANEVKALNVQYNAAIGQAVTDTGAALVDIHTLFATAEANGNALPVSASPPCCSLVYRGGFFGQDGLHPSNTGYAVIAHAFIQTLNSAYSLGIPDINPGAYAGTDPYVMGSSNSYYSSALRVTR
ncbi:MAG: hypothetical protein JOZ86_10715 [Candidatus Eremiobacteraeota bacterium]|nr:hypothetical protein [Candidatus Eremiobacteraeota bacterium]